MRKVKIIYIGPTDYFHQFKDQLIGRIGTFNKPVNGIACTGNFIFDEEINLKSGIIKYKIEPNQDIYFIDILVAPVLNQPSYTISFDERMERGDVLVYEDGNEKIVNGWSRLFANQLQQEYNPIVAVIRYE